MSDAIDTSAEAVRRDARDLDQASFATGNPLLRSEYQRIAALLRALADERDAAALGRAKFREWIWEELIHRGYTGEETDAMLTEHEQSGITPEALSRAQGAAS